MILLSYKSLGNYLGSWQQKMIMKMLEQKKGAIHSLMDLRGKAWQYKSRYEWHLENAIRKYNSGIVKNCNVANDHIIQLGKYGPKGGYGFRVVPRAFL